MWNKEWKMKRKSDRDLNILIHEEYFEYIAEKSAQYDLNKRYCNVKHSVYEDRNDIDINMNNNQMSNNEYFNGMFIHIV